MMTLQGMADHRFTSVSLFTNVFLGEIIGNWHIYGQAYHSMI